MKLRIFTLVVAAVYLLSACTGALDTEVTEATSPPAAEVEQIDTEAPSQAALETQAPVPAETEAQEPGAAQPEAETGVPVESESEQGAFLSGETVLYILPEESEARFLIDEVLLGEPFTVVGTTSALEGEITADLNDPSNSQVNIIVDLTTLLTDNGNRNGAIQRWILETGEPGNQTAEFKAGSISGMPDQVAVGETFDFQISGDFSVKGVTKELTFDGSAALVTEDRLEGTASTNVLYTEFTNIPRLPPQVASVEEDMVLDINFVAVGQ